MVCAARAGGGSTLRNIDLWGEDVAATLSCLAALGLEYSASENQIHILRGIGGLKQKKYVSTPIVLDCAESGSTLRFLLPLALLSGHTIEMRGRGRLMKRPIDAYAKAIGENGGRIRQEEGRIRLGGTLSPGTYRLPEDISSQYVSGLLMALPLLEGDSEIILTSPLESIPYVDLSIDVMKQFGVHVKTNGSDSYLVPGRQRYVPGCYEIEGDYSAAAFFLVAGAIGYPVVCKGLRTDSLQGDRRIVDIIKQCGGEVIEREGGGLAALPGKPTPAVIDVRDIPDLVPPIAVLLSFCPGESRIIGAKRLRFKESDRLHSVTQQLNRIGARIIEEEDALVICGVASMKGGIIDPQNDHRIAMAAAIAALRCEKKVRVLDADCVNKSYPKFWDDFSVIEGADNAEPVRGKGGKE